MEIQNDKRILIQALHEIAEEKNIQITTFSQDWIIRLEKASMVKHIYGYDFELNSATAQMIAKDKSAVSDLLQFNHIPHVEHKLFLHPRLANYISVQGNWTDMLNFARQYDFNIVCKPNQGTGGYGVFHIKNQLNLEKTIHGLFVSNRAICLSPFFSVNHEYRVYVLQNRCELIYSKTRPMIIGDGRATIVELIAAKSNAGLTVGVVKQAIDRYCDRLDQILKQGASLELIWKHNLGQGAYPVIVTDTVLSLQLKKLALTCAKALNLSFVAIDIIETNGRYLILEVNSGIMMESFARLTPGGYIKAKSIYTKAVDLMFEKTNR